MPKGASEWGDQQILAATRQEWNPEQTHKRFVLDVGDGNDPITSEFMDPNAIKARTLIDWGEAVRRVIAARKEAVERDHAQRRAERKRREAAGESPPAQPAETVPTAEKTSCSPAPAPSPQPSADVTDDPAAYARANLETAQSRLAQLQTQAQDVLEQIKVTKAATDKWAIIVAQLESE